MLVEFYLENLALIRSLSLEFSPGFTVITGETGAGKSLLLNGLKVLLGERVHAAWYQDGQKPLRVHAVFESTDAGLEKAMDWGIAGEGGEWILERQVHQGGKNRCRINGVPVTVSQLGELTASLVDLHGQHEQQSLLHRSRCLDYLDGYAGVENIKKEVGSLYHNWSDGVRQWRELEKHTAEIKEQKDFIHYQFQELDKAHLDSGEEEELEQKIAQRQHSTKIQVLMQEAMELMEAEERGIFGGLKKLENLSRQAARILPKFNNVVEKIEEASARLLEVRALHVEALEPEEWDEKELDSQNQRLANLQKLKSKYRMDIPSLIMLRDGQKKKLEALDNAQSDSSCLMAELEKAYGIWLEKAKLLSQNRVKSSVKMERSVKTHLARLGLGEGSFKIKWEKAGPNKMSPEAGLAKGIDELEFYFSANPNTELRPLRQVASGGELSRVMLALKTVLAAKDGVPLLVFDEVDSGIGGVTANNVGEALLDLSKDHQVLVVTHLHQVAARAQHQFQVHKKIRSGTSLVEVTALDEAARVEELARMMGDSKSRETTKYATDLLKRLSQEKKAG